MFVVAVTRSAIDSAQFTVTDQREKQLSWCWHGIREDRQAGTSDWGSWGFGARPSSRPQPPLPTRIGRPLTTLGGQRIPDWTAQGRE